MHKNNFDFLRLFFAILVVVHHCYPLTGASEQDPLFYFTGGKVSLTYIGVRGFFIISGYLIFQSLVRSKDLTDYFTKRILRIYPALIIVLFFSVFICAFAYDGSLKDYFTSIKTWSYAFINVTMVKGQSVIPGVFENNPFKKVINGSLWTIAYELSMYFFIAPLFFLKAKPKKTMTFTIVAMLFVLFVARIFFMDQLKTMHVILMFDFWVNFAILFMAGAFLAVIEIEKMNFRIPVLLVTLILLIVCLPFKHFEYIQYLLLPVIIILAGLTYTKGFSSITEKIGDISYGTYIYGFLLQQMIMYYFVLNPLELLAISLPVTLFFGWLSWHLVEKHILAKKKIVYQKIKAIF